jgi:hypothetical protein
MGLGPSCQANISSASTEIPCIVWNPEVHYCVVKNLPLVPLLSQINLVPTLIYIGEDPIFYNPSVCA